MPLIWEIVPAMIAVLPASEAFLSCSVSVTICAGRYSFVVAKARSKTVVVAGREYSTCCVALFFPYYVTPPLDHVGKSNRRRAGLQRSCRLSPLSFTLLDGRRFSGSCPLHA